MNLTLALLGTLKPYKRLIVQGAREHGLPAHWVALLEALPERSAQADSVGLRAASRWRA